MRLIVPDLRDDVVTLRLPAERDTDAINDACQDPEIPRFTRVPSPYGREDATAYVEQSARDWADGTAAKFVIADGATDAVLGSIGVMHLAAEQQNPEIGYWVARTARRRGIAARAVVLASRWALRELAIARLDLMTRVENVASQGVAERAGFTREGVLRSFIVLGEHRRDVVMYSLLPGDLQA